MFLINSFWIVYSNLCIVHCIVHIMLPCKTERKAVCLAKYATKIPLFKNSFS